MNKLKQNKIGLISDSHGMNLLLENAIHALRELGAKTIIHLGDICDSQKSESLESAVQLLKKNNVLSIKGNNECYIITERKHNKPYDIKDSTISFIEELPFHFAIDDLCFTHSLPFDFPAATRYPITEYMPMFVNEKSPSFRIMFRGHSHSTSIIEMFNGQQNNISQESGKKIQLLSDRRYIITIGALEDLICALYDPQEDVFHSIAL